MYNVNRDFQSNVDIKTLIFGKLIGDDIILLKIYIHLTHNFLIIVIMSKFKLNSLSLNLQLKYHCLPSNKWIMSLFGHESVWVTLRLHLIPF